MALFTTDYNFVRIHKKLRVTPAMAAGVNDKLWEVSDIVASLKPMTIAKLTIETRLLKDKPNESKNRCRTGRTRLAKDRHRDLVL